MLLRCTGNGCAVGEIEKPSPALQALRLCVRVCVSVSVCVAGGAAGHGQS